MKLVPTSAPPVERLTLQVFDLAGAAPSNYDPLTGQTLYCFAADES